MELNTLSIIDRVQTEAAAYELLEDLRWEGNPVCPHCGAGNPMFLTPMNGVSRKTRTGSMSERRVWKCRQNDCRKQFSVLTNTIFHGSKVPVRTWLLVIFEMCANKNGIAAREVQRKYGLTAKSAWFLTQRIREAMKRDPLAGLLSGVVVSDETWFGGQPKFRHGGMRKGKQGVTDKQPILSLISKDTGEVRSFTLPRVTSDNLMQIMKRNIATDSTLHTDESQMYKIIGPSFANHESVTHKQGEYVRGEVSTNPAEGYFSQLKRSIDGTHHHLSVKHLDRYLAEFDLRFSTRKMTDSNRMKFVIGKTTGRRLTYKPLAGN